MITHNRKHKFHSSENIILSASCWEKIKWIIVTAINLRRTAYPLTTWGARLILASLGISVVAPTILLSIEFETGYIIKSLEITANDASFLSIIMSFLIASCGGLLIYKEWNQKTRHTAKLLIASLPGCSTDFPEYIIDNTEKPLLREAVTLGQLDGYTENIQAQINRYNAERYVDLLNRFVLHDNCCKLYIGGLARVPMLVAYGALLKNISAEIKYFDKLHQNGKWKLLDDVNDRIHVKQSSQNIKVNSNGDIGIAVGFTSKISIDQLPDKLKSSTMVLEPTSPPARNLIKNQENLNEIADEISNYIDELSAMPCCKRIHLFLSVQSSLAIAIGRRYQEGMHKNWIIHNYDAASGVYSWSIELSKDGIKLNDL